MPKFDPKSGCRACPDPFALMFARMSLDAASVGYAVVSSMRVFHGLSGG
jgi:hypothetical protein